MNIRFGLVQAKHWYFVQCKWSLEFNHYLNSVKFPFGITHNGFTYTKWNKKIYCLEVCFGIDYKEQYLCLDPLRDACILMAPSKIYHALIQNWIKSKNLLKPIDNISN